jgi:FtsP/CotA-like multicopper oxidase with cupredoxin domain
VTFSVTFLIDLGAAVLAVVLIGAVLWRPERERPLLMAALGALLIRAAADLTLARNGWVFAARPLLVDLPLSAVPVLAALAWSFVIGRAEALVRIAVATGVVAAIDPVLLPGPRTLAALIALALIGPLSLSLSPVGPATRPDGGPLAGPGRRVPAAVAGLLIAALMLDIGLGWWRSRLPGRYDLADFAAADSGTPGTQVRPEAMTAADHAAMADAASIPVTALTGPAGAPDVRVSLTAAPLTVRRDGRAVAAVAFNGTIPGPPIRASVGDLVQVHVCNRGDVDGVSVHWHGYDVPNAEDGVAGVTQDAIRDGQCQDYRFRANRPGSYWYHAHQASFSQVDRGLYGALLVLPAAGTATAAATGNATGPASATADLTVLDHAWRPPGGFLAGASWQPGARTERSEVRAGTAVRLRLVNTDRLPHRYRLIGAGFDLIAVDGTDVTGPTRLGADRSLLLAAGGRYDLGFTMPAGGVRLTGLGENSSLRLTATGSPAAGPGVPEQPAASHLDLLSYGSPAADSGPANRLRGRPDREFTLVMDRRLTFTDGRIGYGWAVNGQTYPRMPMLMVAAGDLVRVRLVNRTTADHPMHLHGHHVLVLSRNGQAATGSPWWSDTLNVAPGEQYVVAFWADNPGIWMDHCHDLKHAADGFVLHLAYTQVSTPFRIGSQSANRPE